MSDAYIAYEERQTYYKLVIYTYENDRQQQNRRGRHLAKLRECGEACRGLGQLMLPATWPANENVFLSGPQLAYNIGWMTWMRLPQSDDREE